ncbi:MAG: chemotaxis protein CheW [Pseudanabaena sp.]|nr:MAG: chemotaxis protein CheW [Pseudanabaena sp.]
MNSLQVELYQESSQTVVGFPYLSLQLEPNVTVALKLSYVRETLTLAADHFTQMPNVHPCLMGLIEHRSSVFWVLDLPQLLGFAPIDSTVIETHIAVLQIANMFLGLGVYRIGRVKRIIDAEIRSPVGRELPSAITPFLQGLVEEEIDQEKVYVLDVEAIARFSFSV